MIKKLFAGLLISASSVATANAVKIPESELPDIYEMGLRKHGIPEEVSRALFRVESSGKQVWFKDGRWQIVRSPSDALGIGQVKQITADWLGCVSLYDKRQNADCAISYLAWIRDNRCGEDWSCVIAKYHDGHNSTRISKDGREHVRKFWAVYGK